MIGMEPMSTTVSDETLRILRRFYPPPDPTADMLLYEGDQFVRLSDRSRICDMEERSDLIQSRGSSICHPAPEKDQETAAEVHPLAVSR